MTEPDALSASALRTLDPTSGVPSYRQIADQLGAHLERMDVGARLPSETEIARVLGVSRGTAVQALRELERQDRVVRVQGRGTFKAPPRPGSFTRHLQAGPLPSFTDELCAAGHETSEVIHRCARVPAGDAVATALGVAPGASVWALERTILADATPVVHLDSWLRADRYPELDPDAIASLSLYRFLVQRYGADARPSWADEEYTAAAVGADDAAALRIPAGSPVLCSRRVAYLADGQAVELVHSKMRADAYRVKATVLPGVERTAGPASQLGTDGR